jgi:hypothetical protein
VTDIHEDRSERSIVVILSVENLGDSVVNLQSRHRQHGAHSERYALT